VLRHREQRRQKRSAGTRPCSQAVARARIGTVRSFAIRLTPMSRHEDTWKAGPSVRFREHTGRGYWDGETWKEW
jgi:hypothetical protein